MKGNKMIFQICECCGEKLKKREWPWSYRSIGNLCIRCKEKARILLNIKEKTK
jgi:hypothetical protein